MKYKKLFPYLFIIAFSLPDFFSISSPIFSTIYAFLLFCFVFFLGSQKLILPKAAVTLLVAANAAMLLASAVFHRIFLVNLLFIMAFVWQAICPYLLKWKHSFEAATALSIVLILAVPLFRLNLPLFPLTLLPSYLAGYAFVGFRPVNWKQTKRLLLLYFSLPFSVLAALFYKTRGLPFGRDLLFARFYQANLKTADYLPVLYLLMLWSSVSLCALILLKRKIKDGEPPAPASMLFVRRLKEDASNLSLLLLLPAFILFAFDWMLREQLPYYSANYVLCPEGIFNLILIGSFYLLLYSLLGKKLSTGLLGLFAVLLMIGNFIKLRYFEEPFYPWDVSLIKEALMIGGHYVPWWLWVALALLLVAAILLLIKRGRRFIKALVPKPSLYALPVAAALVACGGYAFTQPDALATLNIQKSWYTGKSEMTVNGVAAQYVFYMQDLNNYFPSAPKGYSKDTMQQLSASLAGPAGQSQPGAQSPNIVVIMNESFWDPTQFESVSFSTDILNTVHQYRSGTMISPVFGAKTANTEFEALTGFSNFFINPGVIPYNVYLRRNTPSVVSALRDDGYETVAIHPNVGSFYSRSTVYKNIGFEKFIDISGFGVRSDAEGYLVADDQMTDKILSILNENTGKPKFIFALTIQNHDPYINKYDTLAVSANSPLVTDAENKKLSTYAQGVYDADKALGKLIDALKASGTPTNLYFFGDHLPRLGSDNDIYDIYKKLGFFTDPNAIYNDPKQFSVPLVTWSNYQQLAKFPLPVSPAQLAYQIFADSGVSHPSYFNILGELREKYPMLHSILSGADVKNDETVKQYQMIQYDLLFGKQYLK